MLPALIEVSGTVFRCFSSSETPGKEKDKYMENPITENVPDLLGSAVLVKTATEEYGAGIPMVQNTSANIGADINALTTAVNNLEAGKTAYTASRLVEDAIVKVCRDYVLFGRDMLKPQLGREYNSAYEAIGLIGTSKVPYTGLELQPILQSYKAYFAANPTLEYAALNITATRAQDLYDQLLTARSDTSTKKTELQILRDLRDTAAEKLRRRIRAVINELDFALDPLDARWTAFGFNKPGAKAIPDVPENISAILIGPNAVALKWEASARADYYRVWKKVRGTDNDYVVVGSPADLDFTIENLPVNSTIEIVVTAVNSGGETQYSQAVTITTHA